MVKDTVVWQVAQSSRNSTRDFSHIVFPRERERERERGSNARSSEDGGTRDESMVFEMDSPKAISSVPKKKSKLNRGDDEKNRVHVAKSINKRNETKKRQLLSLIPFHIR